jgi:hypothetical protein
MTEMRRFSTIRYKAMKTLTSTWEEKQAKRTKFKEMKSLENACMQRKIDDKRSKRAERADREKRKLENTLKSASFQVVRRVRLSLSSPPPRRSLKPTS